MVRLALIVHTSPMSIVATSPADTLRVSAPPSLVDCSITAFSVRKAPSMRTLVIVRWRMMAT